MKRFQIIFITFFVLSLLSCDKNEADDIYGKWEVIGFISLESSLYPKKEEGFNPIVEFNNDSSYLLKLDRNSCSGFFTLSVRDSISISPAGCTKICCDSEFSQRIAQILPQVKTYQIEKNKLKLEVPNWGWMDLELYD